MDDTSPASPGTQEDKQPPSTSDIPDKKANGSGNGTTHGHNTPLRGAEVAFQRWFGEGFDLDLLHAVLATVAAEKLAGDPLWLMIVGGPGSAKTETLNTLRSSGARVMSCITSPAAFLSGATAPEVGEGEEIEPGTGTGGVLRALGGQGFLVFKDFTSILSMHHTMRAAVLAALREIYDGHWVRDLGNKGGQSLEWTGRIGLIGAVTGVWDNHYEVIGQMGDRFVLLRLDSHENRAAATTKAMLNVGQEVRMREDLSFAARQIIERVPRGIVPQRDDGDLEPLLQAANLVTMARSTVTRDYKGNLDDVHAPEMPTRFVKQLVMLLHGAKAIGLDREAALALTMRVARDSITPPLRLGVLTKLIEPPSTWNNSGRWSIGDLGTALSRPYQSVKRAAEELWMLGLVERESERDVPPEEEEQEAKRGRPRLLYNISVDWLEQTRMLITGRVGS